MSAWKQFLASDIIINPFVVNKSFTFTSGTGSGQFAYLGYTSSISGEIIDKNAVGINRFIGRNGDYFLSSSTAYLTGQLISSLSGSAPSYLADFTQYNQVLVYNSVKQLYYTNFISSSTGDNVATASIFLGSNSSGDVLVGGVASPLYDNFLQSTLLPDRFFPTASDAEIGVISIPSKLYGDYIVPNSLILQVAPGGSGSYTAIDDGEGNVIFEGTGEHLGNIIYTHGIIILTVSGSINQGYGTSIYGVSLYGAGYPPPIDWINNPLTCSFSSSVTIYEAQYKCTIRESEFNATLNPSAQKSGSVVQISSSYFYQRGDGTLNNNVTGSYFSPYVTTVGLYDEAQNLLAVGKLAQPLPTSDTTDTTILINIDK
jgi:hypothetical protein